MKEFKVKQGNFIKSNDDTKKIMYRVILALVPIILFAFYKNGILPLIRNTGSPFDLINLVLIILTPVVVSIFTEYIYYIIKKDKKTFTYLIEESFAIIPGLFIGLIIPIHTPLWLVALAALIGSLSKMVFGGLGKNPLNPALFGSLFIIVFASSYIGKFGGYMNSYELDALSTATPLSHFSALAHVGTYKDIIGPYGSLLTFFFGNIPGAIGETSSLLCIIAFIYLTITKTIKWRLPVYYVLTVFIMTLVIGLTNNMGLWYPLFNVLSGGLLFGAVFMTTDPVTSPVSNQGQILGGIILGILTVYIRYLTPYPEGVLISILIFNILTLIINRLSIKFNFNKLYKIISLIIVIIIGIILTIIISNRLDNSVSTSEVDPNFTVTNKEVIDGNNIYYVTSRGFNGKKSIKSKITMNNNNIINIEILSTSESYYKMIEDANYIDKLITNQNSLDSLDTVSGATYTSSYLKELIEKIKIYDKK